MSIPAFAWALEQGVELCLTPSERLVLIYLADQANGERFCFCGQPRIMKFTGLAMRTVRSVIHSLEKRQLIRVEAKPGYATHYHILRPDTPANGAMAANDTPANQRRDTPANGAGAPRQNVPDHPGKSCTEPRHITTGTPAKCPTDPSITQEETLSARARAREGKISDSGKEATAPPPAPPPAVPVIGTTDGSAPPNADGFNDWLDSGAPADGLVHCATDSEEITEDDPPKTDADRERMAARCRALIEELSGTKQSPVGMSGGGKLSMQAYPPGYNPVRDRWDQIEAYKPALPDVTLKAEQLAAARRIAMARAL